MTVSPATEHSTEHGARPASEWAAAAVRPVAHWELQRDRKGRARPVMRWAVPRIDAATVIGSTRH